MRFSGKGPKISRRAADAVRGSVCIFLALILLPVVASAGMIADAARIEAARLEISGAADLAANTALSYYDRTLREMYGLFAVSGSEKELQENAAAYFRRTLEGNEFLDMSDPFTRQFINGVIGSAVGSASSYGRALELSAESFSVNGVGSSVLGDPAVLKRQICEYMKYRAPVELSKGLMTKISCFRESSKQSKAVEKKLVSDNKIGELEDVCRYAFEKLEDLREAEERLCAGRSSAEISSQLASDLEYLGVSLRLAFGYALLCEKYRGDTVPSGGMEAADRSEYRRILSQDGEAAAAVCLGGVLSRLASDAGIVRMKRLCGTTQISTASAAPSRMTAGAAGTLLDRWTDYLECLRSCSASLGHYASAGETLSGLLDKGGEALAEEIGALGGDAGRLRSAASAAEGLREEVSAGAEAITELASKAAGDWSASGAALMHGAWYTPLAAVRDAASAAGEALKKLKAGAASAEKSLNEYKSAVDDLSESPVKASLYEDYLNSAEGLSSVEIDRMTEFARLQEIYAGGAAEKLAGLRVAGYDPDIDGWESRERNADLRRIRAAVAGAAGSGGSPAEAAGGLVPPGSLPSAGEVLAEAIVPIGPTGGPAEAALYLTLKELCASKGAESSVGTEEAAELKKTLVSMASDGGERTDLPSDTPSSFGAAVGDDLRKELMRLSSGAGNIAEAFSLDRGISADSDDDKTAEKAASDLKLVSGFLDGVKKLASAAAEDLYCEEYITGMFSCFTDVAADRDAKVLSLSGCEMSGNVFFGSEIEYILWGADSPRRNLNYTKTVIFGIRFALNTVYAMTSAELRGAALGAAAAIAGWTGFGIPIVQNVILVAWSMAESVADLNSLCKGNSVPIYKTAGTWTLGLGGAKTLLVNTAADYACGALDELFGMLGDSLSGAASAGIGELADKVTDVIDGGIDGVYESVRSAVAVPVERLASKIAVMTQEPKLADIEASLRESLAALKGSCGGLTGKCLDLAADRLISSDVRNLARQLREIYTRLRAPGGAKETLEQILYGKNGDGGIIGSLFTKLKSYISGTVGKYSEQFRSEIVKEIGKGTDAAKDLIKKRIGSFVSGLTSDRAEDVSTAGGGLTAGAAMSMNYRDYLKLFVLLGFAANGNAMLRRTAELIQINMNSAPGGEDFNIAAAPTFVTVSVCAGVGTLFAGRLLTGAEGAVNGASGGLQSAYGAGRVVLTYTAVDGY
jgi:hypothetical protein